MDNFISVKGAKGVKGRKPTARVGDLVLASVAKGIPAMRKQVVFAIIVRLILPRFKNLGHSKNLAIYKFFFELESNKNTRL